MLPNIDIFDFYCCWRGGFYIKFISTIYYLYLSAKSSFKDYTISYFKIVGKYERS